MELVAMLSGCGGASTPGSTAPAAANFTLTVNSANPASGVVVSANPADVHGLASGTTAFTMIYKAGTIVTLAAPATAGANTFSAWTGCGGTSAESCTLTMNGNVTVSAGYSTPPVIFPLTVNSTNPSSGVPIAASPADNGGLTSGNTSFALNYASGRSVKLTAPATSGTNQFTVWTGCTSVVANVCTITMSAAETVSAAYAPANGVVSITVRPSTSSVAIGSGQQFTAAVAGNGSYDSSVTWSVAADGGLALDTRRRRASPSPLRARQTRPRAQVPKLR